MADRLVAGSDHAGLALRAEAIRIAKAAGYEVQDLGPFSGEKLAKCQVGVCDPTFCADNTFCKFGEQCGAQPDAGSPTNVCYSDFDDLRRPYCANCTWGAGIETCGTGANYCLIDTAHPGNYFCGVDCAEGQSCPRAYACQDVIVVFSQWQCSRANPTCPINTQLPCTQDVDCKRGGVCLTEPGATHRDV